MSFTELFQRSGLENKGVWKYLQIRDHITTRQFPQGKNPVTAFSDSPGAAHKAAVFYNTFNGSKALVITTA